jgi:hypothetical protein
MNEVVVINCTYYWHGIAILPVITTQGYCKKRTNYSVEYCNRLQYSREPLSQSDLCLILELLRVPSARTLQFDGEAIEPRCDFDITTCDEEWFS